MKKVWLVVWVCAFGFFGFDNVNAKVHSQSGTSIFPFLKTELDVRTAAMGGVGVTESCWNNPALLAEVDSQKVSFARAQGFHDINENFVSYQYPGKLPTGIGLFCQGTNLGDSYNEEGIKIPAIATSDVVILASVAGKTALGRQYCWTSEGLFWGITGKIIRSRIENYGANGIGIDAGLLYKFSEGKFYDIPLDNLKIGLGLQNLGPRARGSPLPRVLRAGGSYQYNDNFLLALEFKKPRDDFLSVSFGGEYQYDIFFLRLGYASGSEGGVSCGLGVSHENLRIDYAIEQSALGNNHRISVSYEIGGKK